MLIQRILVGVVFIIIGGLVIKYNRAITNFAGRNSFFEQKLGPASTYMMYMFLGLFLVLIGLLTVTGFHSLILDKIAEFLRSIFQPFG